MFNIYLEHVLEDLKNNLRLPDLFYKAYADDLVMIVKHDYLCATLRQIKIVSEKHNLKLNSKKSNWIKIKNHKGTDHRPNMTSEVL